MKYSYTNQQMREADARTIEKGTSSMTLLERAGQALADAVRRAMEKLNVGDVLFVCGGGNNGGDGFVAARILHEEGVDVQVLCIAEKFSDECAAAKKRFRGDVIGRIPRRRYALIVDCIFGTGLSRAPAGTERLLIDFINDSGAYVVACDLPSGLKEGGVAFANCVRADETLTLGYYKNSLCLADGADHAGKITVADIGITSSEKGAEIWEDEDVKALFPKRLSHSHKGTYGSACIVAGEKMGGAALLAAGGCLKSGAGYTRLYVPGRYMAAAVGRYPACIVSEFHGLQEEMLRSDSIAVGMGMGVTAELYAFIKKAISFYGGTLILDADAIGALAVYGADILKQKRKCRIVITPHPGEFAALLGTTVDKLQNAPVGAAISFAQKYGVTVLLKNNRSIVTDGVRTAINLTGSPALAKGGSGDVLAGLLAGLSARVPLFEASCAASYLLGRAGELSAERTGEYASDATDVIECIPSAIKNLS